MRVLLADDHALVRAGIRALLAGLPDVETVVEAGDGQEALAVLRETKPDLALIDIAMSPPRTIAEVERWYVEQVLTETRWVIEGERGAARRLGLHPNTLRSRMARLGLASRTTKYRGAEVGASPADPEKP